MRNVSNVYTFNVFFLHIRHVPHKVNELIGTVSEESLCDISLFHVTYSLFPLPVTTNNDVHVCQLMTLHSCLYLGQCQLRASTMHDRTPWINIFAISFVNYKFILFCILSIGFTLSRPHFISQIFLWIQNTCILLSLIRPYISFTNPCSFHSFVLVCDFGPYSLEP